MAISDKLRKKLMKVNAARDTAGKLKALGNIRPGDIGLEIPQNGEPRTGLSMGEHAALTALEWQVTREAQDELAVASHHNLAASYDEGWQDDLITPFHGVERDNNMRAGLLAGEAGHAQAGLRQGRGGHHDRRRTRPR